MLNRAAAIEALMRCMDEKIDREAILEILRQIHPFDLADFQEAIDELEALIIEARRERTVTISDLTQDAIWRGIFLPRDDENG